MKTTLCILATAALLCGCNSSDSKSAKLEARIASLERNNIELFRQANNRWRDVTNIWEMEKFSDDFVKDLTKTNGVLMTMEAEIFCSDNLLKTVADQLIEQEDRQSATATTLSNLISTLNLSKSIPRVAATAPSRGQPPADVAAQIRAAAQKLWPNDYEMQVYEINKQADAWRKLNP